MLAHAALVHGRGVWLCRRCPKRALAASCIVVAADLLERDASKLFPAGLLPWYGAFGARSLDVIQGCRHLMQLILQIKSPYAPNVLPLQ